MRLSQSHESSQGFDKLNQVDPSLIFCLLLIDFFLILSLNVGLIMN